MTTTPEKQAEFIDLLLKVSRKIPVLFDSYARTRGLTLARARTLLALSRSDGVYQKGLAEKLDIENASMVRLIDALEEQGLVARAVAQGNRRANTIHLTVGGKAIVEELESHSAALRNELLFGIMPDKLDEGIEILKHMAAHIGEKRCMP
ncbi:MarR family winged helix-turn-helix transcriptional regulator [Bartonella sp. HY038]|uniref:MarR family winged helix-turn-helix transcriptional regulator n=1 Tax=Bartonella sp. HY038 TaxID=2759660 RepID=UPI0015FA7161|nr:MarR family transcriptional regulator [Bartonella sp. HY038]